MGRRIIRRRRPTMSRRMVVRRSAPVDAPAAAPLPKSTVPKGSPILVATSNPVRTLVLPKLATLEEISLVGLASSPDIALKMLIQEQPDAVIIDTDFGGPLVGLDTAKLMQKTRAQSAIIMLVSNIDANELRSVSRRFGTSWSYIRKSMAARENVLSIALKSSVRGVQWIEPELSRPLAELWKVAAQARDLESRRAQVDPVAIKTVVSQKAMKNSVDQEVAPDAVREPVVAETTDNGIDGNPEGDQADDEFDDEVAPGIVLKSTLDFEDEGIDVTSVSIGKGGIGQDVGKVRRAR